MSILTLSPINPIRKKRQIACSSITNMLEKILKKQNNPWEKLIQTDLVAKSVSITDFLKNRVMRIAFFYA